MRVRSYVPLPGAKKFMGKRKQCCRWQQADGGIVACGQEKAVRRSEEALDEWRGRESIRMWERVCGATIDGIQ